MTAEFVCKPIDTWPGEFTPDRDRQTAPFGGSFHQTRKKLLWELTHLDVEVAIIEIDVTDADLRLDGLPRSSAYVPPPVKVSFEAGDGDVQVFAVDKYAHWHSNLHAVALTLDRLRAIERYGAVRDGQQYAGWKAIGVSSDSYGQALSRLAEIARTTIDEPVDRIVRQAQVRTHPDRGGTADEFAEVQNLAEIVGALT